MKKIFLLLIMLSIFRVATYGDPTNTGSGGNASTTSAVAPPAEKPKQPNENEKKGADAPKPTVADTATCKCATLIPLEKRAEEFNCGMAWLVALPVILFLIFGGIIIYALRDFKLNAALAENIIGKVTVPNKQYDADKLSKMIAAAGSSNNTIVANLATLFPPTVDVSNLIGDDTVSLIENAVQTARTSKSAGDNAQSLKTDAATADAKATASETKAKEYRAAQGNDDAAKATADASANVAATDRAAANKAKEASNKADADAVIADNNAKAAANALVTAIDDAKNKASGTPANNKGKNPFNYYFRPSSSRLIAFISSMLTIIIGLSMSSFYFYEYMYTGCPPDLSALSKVLLTLGLGLTPYGANKLAGAITANKSDPQS